MLCRLSSTTDEIKEFYNNNYDKICDVVYPEELLKQAIKINGFKKPQPLSLGRAYVQYQTYHRTWLYSLFLCRYSHCLNKNRLF
jgi:hypothetical protein